MLLAIHPDNPEKRKIKEVVDLLKRNGVGIIPTDSVYSFCCAFNNPKGIETISKLVGKKVNKANFSMIFKDLSQVSGYTKPINNSLFRMLQRNLPGPFTFILNASNEVPRIFKTNRKTIGIRIPSNTIVRDLCEMMDIPMVVASVHDDDSIIDYTTDPEQIFENWGNRVDFVIDGGIGNISPSTVVDCSGDTPEIIREGIQELE